MQVPNSFLFHIVTQVTDKVSISWKWYGDFHQFLIPFHRKHLVGRVQPETERRLFPKWFVASLLLRKHQEESVSRGERQGRLYSPHRDALTGDSKQRGEDPAAPSQPGAAPGSQGSLEQWLKGRTRSAHEATRVRCNFCCFTGGQGDGGFRTLSSQIRR